MPVRWRQLESLWRRLLWFPEPEIDQSWRRSRWSQDILQLAPGKIGAVRQGSRFSECDPTRREDRIRVRAHVAAPPSASPWRDFCDSPIRTTKTLGTGSQPTPGVLHRPVQIPVALVL